VMSGTQVQKVSVVSVSRARSISDWGTWEAEASVVPGPLSPPPPHAASSQALEAAAALEMRNFRRVNADGDDIAVLSGLIEMYGIRPRWLTGGAGRRNGPGWLGRTVERVVLG
jgi:hypothetical protein